MSHNWQNFYKKLKLSDTTTINAFFSKQKSTKKLEVNERSENRPSTSEMVIHFVEQAKVGNRHQHPQAKISLLIFPSLKHGFNPFPNKCLQ